MELSGVNIEMLGKAQQNTETPLKAGRSGPSCRKICFSPITLKPFLSPQETCSHSRKNYFELKINPIFSHTTPSASCEPHYLHAASINGDAENLNHAISEGGLRWLEFRDRLGRTPLIYACLGNRPKCVMVLLRAGASPNSVDCHGRSAFHWAAIKGLYECFKLMHIHENNSEESFQPGNKERRGNSGWRMKDKEGATPLHLSVCDLSTECCQYIVQNATAGDIDSQDTKKRTPLHWAAAAGNSKGIKILLKSNARVDLMDENGKPPLFYAVSSLKNDAVKCLKILMEKSLASLNWNDNEGRCALHLAVADQPDGTEIVEMLIKYGKFRQLKDKVGRTPLHWAAIFEKTHMLMILLAYFPDILSCQDEHGATALHYAAMSNYVEIVQQIAASDCTSLEVEDAQGKTPLFWAAGNNSCEAVQELVNAGADIDHPDEGGHSVLHVAAMNSSTACVKLLLKLGAKVNSVDKVGNTPFGAACYNGRLDIIACLATNGVEIDTTNIYERKPIHLAAHDGHTLIAEYLIKTVCDINCKDIHGLSPLHIACHRGHKYFVSLLLERGALQNIQDNIGWTPLHYAVYGNHYEVAQILLDHCANPNILSIDGKTVLDACYDAGERIFVNQLLKYGAVASSLKVKTTSRKQ